MSHNSLYPAFIVLSYNSNSHDHLMRIPVACDQDYPPGTPATNIFLFMGDPAGAGDVLMSEALDAFVALLKPFFPASATINRGELWVYPNETSDPIWTSVHELDEVGTGAGGAQPNGQAVISYRSSFGGIARHYLMETIFAPNARAKSPLPVGTIRNLSNYVASPSGSWIRARDNGYLVTPIAWTTKTNDQLRKKFVLDA